MPEILEIVKCAKRFCLMCGSSVTDREWKFEHADTGICQDCWNRDGDALAFLKRATAEHCRIVSSNDLDPATIALAQAEGRFFVDPATAWGWALLPMKLPTKLETQTMHNLD